MSIQNVAENETTASKGTFDVDLIETTARWWVNNLVYNSSLVILVKDRDMFHTPRSNEQVIFELVV